MKFIYRKRIGHFHRLQSNNSRMGPLLGKAVVWPNARWCTVPRRVVNLGRAEISGRNGPAHKNLGTGNPEPGPICPGRSCPILFLSVFLKDFFKENLNFIIHSFQIKHCSFKKWQNIGEIFAEYWQKTARPAEILGLNGPAQLKFGK